MTEGRPTERAGFDEGEGVVREFERLLTEIDDEDPYAERHLTVGNMGSMSERLGPERAQALAQERSLTQYTRVRAARRLGEIASRSL